MLIRFSVENYLSFNERQELSMVAGVDKEMEESHCLTPGGANSKIKLLKSAAVYGPNASGKSNLVKAIWFMRECVLRSVSGDNGKEAIKYQPFKLDKSSFQKPGFFEIDFFLEDIVHNYGFRIHKGKVVEEWLYFYPQNRKVLLFHRELIQEDTLELSAQDKKSKRQYEYKFGTRLKGEKNKIKSLTRDDSLYLSVGAQFAHPDLTRVFLWFRDFLKPGIKKDTFRLADFTSGMVEEDVVMKKNIVNFLQYADLGIRDVQIEKIEKNDVRDFEKLPYIFRKEIEDGKWVDVKMVHSAESGEEQVSVEFSLKEESQGTQRMFQLAGPLFEVLTYGGILVIDEIEDSLHFNLIKSLLSQFFELSKNAQIIFTTHNVQLLEEKLFRRDEIWFTEKRTDGSTELFSLAEFKPKPRKDKSLKNGYLTGAYGAIPVLGDLFGEE